ncbi:undecaprenyl-diphosphate phosphatase [Candidatus Woesebacteria bacterium]|nr:undecaprenyl-diphosphate phosphatase [Candidatus Woesebacteria bacterium]
MNNLQAIILGIVEGLTEFLPVSSTFHLIFSAKLLGLESSEFLKLFDVFIQSGAIFALVFIYATTLLTNKKLFMNVVYAFIPTAIVGTVLYKVIKGIFFEADWLMLGVFILVGILFIFLEKYLKNHQITLAKNCDHLTPRDSLIIGTSQALSVVPGVSRAGSVIVAMMILGYKREEAAKFTFLLSLPTIFAASAMDLYQSRELLASMSGGWGLLATGSVISLIVAYLVVKWFTTYLAHHTLEIFGWYRLVLGSLIIISMALL